jgi:hypothetical protein
MWYQYLVKGLFELGLKQSKLDECVFHLYQYLVKGLFELGLKQSKLDECVFHFGSSIMLVHVDDSTLL